MNIFEKHGIKEVCDVLFEKIDKVEEKYDSQRTIFLSTVLKGAIKKIKVYPMTAGVGSSEADGFYALAIPNVDIVAAVAASGTFATNIENMILEDFAIRQNLFTKTGERYSFKLNPTDVLFGDFDFDTNYASVPYGSEKVCIIKIDGSVSYDTDEVMALINQNLSSVPYLAKGYDITYQSPTELVNTAFDGNYDPTKWKESGGVGYTAASTLFDGVDAVLKAGVELTALTDVGVVDGQDNLTPKANAKIYVMRNLNSSALLTDTAGEFGIAIGGTKYVYTDAALKGVEYIALVIVGTKAGIFEVPYYSITSVNTIGWLVSIAGFLTDAECADLADNHIIHTGYLNVLNLGTITVSYEMTALKIKKTIKIVNRYTPVLFLDTLKVSTLEQTAESVSATGGLGNSSLITWDFGKEITLDLQDALYSPASMALQMGSDENGDLTNAVKELKSVDRMEKIKATKAFIIPAGNSLGKPTEAEKDATATVYFNPNTMKPFDDGTPIAEGEVFLKWTRSVAIDGTSLGGKIEISQDAFPGTYKITMTTYTRSQETQKDKRMSIVIPQAKMLTEQTITLEAEGDPTVFSMPVKVLKPEDGKSVVIETYDIEEVGSAGEGGTVVVNSLPTITPDSAKMYKTV